MRKINLFPSLHKVVETFDFSEISPLRKSLLQPFIQVLTCEIAQRGVAELNFICTHNSRRSQLAQIWAKVAADVFAVDVKSFSGGTEVTSLNERIVASLRRFGFHVDKQGASNPKYLINYGSEESVVAFSKMFDDPFNPVAGFTAVMTCSHADETCPFISGAKERISLTYEDPKVFDGSVEEARKYDEHSAQIGREMFYAFSQIVQ